VVVHWQLRGDLDSSFIRDSALAVWISKYCSDSLEAKSHGELDLVIGILPERRYLVAPASP
jgi:hypothetical protein